MEGGFRGPTGRDSRLPRTSSLRRASRYIGVYRTEASRWSGLGALGRFPKTVAVDNVRSSPRSSGCSRGVLENRHCCRGSATLAVSKKLVRRQTLSHAVSPRSIALDVRVRWRWFLFSKPSPYFRPSRLLNRKRVNIYTCLPCPRVYGTVRSCVQNFLRRVLWRNTVKKIVREAKKKKKNKTYISKSADFSNFRFRGGFEPRKSAPVYAPGTAVIARWNRSRYYDFTAASFHRRRHHCSVCGGPLRAIVIGPPGRVRCRYQR